MHSNRHTESRPQRCYEGDLFDKRAIFDVQYSTRNDHDVNDSPRPLEDTATWWFVVKNMGSAMLVRCVACDRLGHGPCAVGSLRGPLCYLAGVVG